MTNHQLTFALISFGSFINSAAMTVHSGATWPSVVLFAVGAIGAIAIGILPTYTPPPPVYGMGQGRAMPRDNR